VSAARRTPSPHVNSRRVATRRAWPAADRLLPGRARVPPPARRACGCGDQRPVRHPGAGLPVRRPLRAQVVGHLAGRTLRSPSSTWSSRRCSRAPRHTASIPSCGPLAASPTPSDAPPGCVTTPAQVWRLPSYAPELNPVEALWANLKGKGGELANFAGDTLDQVAAADTGGSRPGTATLARAVLVPSPLRLVPVVSSTAPRPFSVGRLIGRAGRPGARRSTPPRRGWRPRGCRSGRCVGSCAAPRCRPGGTAAGPGRRWRPG
jgi:hypothetical protein